MATIEPAVWSATTDYTSGDRVTYNGIGYEATATHTASSTNPVDNSNWKVYAVFRITDYYSLQEFMEFEGNPNNDMVIRSIPSFIQNAEFKMEKFLRSPGQRVRRVFDIDRDSSFELAGDEIEIEHVRRNTDASNGRTLLDRGAYSIQSVGDDRTTFERVRQDYRDFLGFPGVDFPVYFVDDARLYIAPDYENGTEIEVTYWQRVPELGSTVGILNDDFEPVNADDQTADEWVAAGNDRADFVQAEEVVTSNLWTATTPHLLKAMAMVEMSIAMNDERLHGFWETQANTLAQLTVEEFKKFDTQGSVNINQGSGYESDGYYY